MVAEDKSCFDGFFLFEEIPLGSYFIQVAAEELSGTCERQETVITREDPIDIVELVIKQSDEEPSSD